MNKSATSLKASTRIVPPDSLLKFGYSPSGGIEFDSSSALLNFSYDGTPKVDIASQGLMVRDGNGMVVGHTAQLAMLGQTNEFQVIGTEASDTGMAIGAWRANTGAPYYTFAKSRNATPGSFTVVQDNDPLGYLRAVGDDGTTLNTPAAEIKFEVDGTPGTNSMPGAMVFGTNAGGTNVTEALRIDSSQNVQIPNGIAFVGDSANTDMTVGLTINQGANDNQILAFKSSDVAHGATNVAETDTWGEVYKLSASDGGVNIRGFSDGGGRGINIQGVAGGTVATTATTSEYAIITTVGGQVVNAGNAIAPPSNSLIFGVVAHAAVAFVVDEDGDYFYNGADGGAFDKWDDLSLVRAFDLEVSDPASLVKSEWDKFVSYKEPELVRTDVLSAPVAEGGMVSGRQLARVHNGAIWQLNTKHMSLVERVDSLSVQLEAANNQLTALTAPENI